MPASRAAFPEFAPAAVTVEERPNGVKILRSPRALAPHEDHLGQMLRRWATEAPDRIFLAERNPEGHPEAWRTLTYGEALRRAEAVGQALLERGLGPERPVMILSGNSVGHGVLMLGALLAGIPVAPISPAYSLLSQDHGKLRHIFDRVRPGLVYGETREPFAAALESLPLDGVEVLEHAALAGLFSTPVGSALRRGEATVGPDTVAKILFTSGSTGIPKGVINSHRMLCANQAMIAQCWPFLAIEEPPVLLDWLPWNHTFGANHNFNLVLKHGGSLYIDGGKPTPDLIATSVANLRLISPTLYFNVPAGFAALLPFLEEDPELRTAFFRRLRMIFYAAAALPDDLWRRLETLSLDTLGHRVAMTSAWGSTETAPMATTVHFPIERAGVIGLPPPGVEIKLVPSGDRQELRVRGPNVTPGYWREPQRTVEAFDREGFYKIGDAGRLADPGHPERGLIFDGRVAEDFKLTTGTWVHVGGLRVKVLEACAPILQDAVITGADRAEIGVLAWPNVAACRQLLGDPDGTLEALVEHPRILAHLRRGLEAHNTEHPASSTRITRALLMAEPPSIDQGEITDKGYINQRATLENRRELVEGLYGEAKQADTVLLGPQERPTRGPGGTLL
jgi:feruloyl-CoA synthase